MTTTPLPRMRYARCYHAAAIVGRKLFVIGGGPRRRDTIEVLDLENLHNLENLPEWRVLDARLENRLVGCAAVVACGRQNCFTLLLACVIGVVVRFHLFKSSMAILKPCHVGLHSLLLVVDVLLLSLETPLWWQEALTGA